MEDLLFRPVSELAELVRSGQLGAAELVEASLRAIEARDGSLGAFVEVDADGALAAARAIAPGDRRPFAGVPIAIKGNVPVEGRLVTMGSRALAGYRASHDAFLVRRLREAGFVVVGITKLPEFGILPTTEPADEGPARNPWDPSRTPGGSSGGSAAAVAAGMVPVAHGNDGGGSLRIPAACCGLVGLKPSRGRISRGPDLGESPLSVEGVLTRTVNDTALLLDVLAGYEAGDATWAARPVESYRTTVRRDPGTLRIAFSGENALGVPVDEQNAHALREAATLLGGLGHEVVEAGPYTPGPEGLPLFLGVFGPSVALGMAFARLVLGRDPSDDEVEPLSRAMWDLAAAESATQFLVNWVQLHALSRAIIAFWADHDLLVTPVLAERPLPVGELDGSIPDAAAAMERSGRFTPYPALFNATGQPAISVPMGFGEDGLPSAVQIVGKPLGEDTLLQVAAQIESARPWAGRRPDVVSA